MLYFLVESLVFFGGRSRAQVERLKVHALHLHATITDIRIHVQIEERKKTKFDYLFVVVMLVSMVTARLWIVAMFALAMV